jgi:hypothetical protein
MRGANGTSHSSWQHTAGAARTGLRSTLRPLVAGSLAVVLLSASPVAVALAQETITQLPKIPAGSDTCCKPQSKVWFHAGHWWAVLPGSGGTWLWRLEANNTWTDAFHLSAAASTRADAKVVGDVTHVLLHGSAPKLASIEYNAGTGTYQAWSVRPNPTPISLPGSETATIDIDSLGRMWLSTEEGSNVKVFYSDYPYASFTGPILLATNIASDDITAVTAIPALNAVGVLWSNQNTKRFGFRIHKDSDLPDASNWMADEVPASQSALNIGGGMGDDHLNTAVGSDGTFYASIKTSYNSSSATLIGLLVRRPSGTPPAGTWDNLYQVDTIGTRGIVLLNEPADLLRVVYTSNSGGGNILYRDSLISAIGFGARKTLITGGLNNSSSTKENWTDTLVVIASGHGVLFTRSTGGSTTTTTSSTSTSTSRTSTSRTSTTSVSSTSVSTTSVTSTSAQATPTSTTSTSVTTTTATTLPGGAVTTYQAVDTNIRLSTLTTNYGSDLNLYVGVTNGPDKVYRTLMEFSLAGIPAGATVNHCMLAVNVTQRTNPTAGHVHRLCSQHWLDGEGQSEAQATWNEGKTGFPWTVAGAAGSTADCSAGGDYTTTDAISYTPPTGTGPFTFPDLKVLCQDAVANQAGWLRLRISQDLEGTQSNLIKLDSSETNTVANRPRLTVTWSP